MTPGERLCLRETTATRLPPHRPYSFFKVLNLHTSFVAPRAIRAMNIDGKEEEKRYAPRTTRCYQELFPLHVEFHQSSTSSTTTTLSHTASSPLYHDLLHPSHSLGTGDSQVLRRTPHHRWGPMTARTPAFQHPA